MKRAGRLGVHRLDTKTAQASSVLSLWGILQMPCNYSCPHIEGDVKLMERPPGNQVHGINFTTSRTDWARDVKSERRETLNRFLYILLYTTPSSNR